LSEAVLNDAELVGRMAQGDRAALSTLYQRHAARLMALALGIVRDPAEAEDLLHDVFMETWRHAFDYSPERGSVRAWLTTRTRSRALDRIKSAHRRHNVPEEHAPDGAVSARFDDRFRLREILREMPETQRDVLLLSYFEDLSASEIAERLDIPVGTVKSRTRAALATLRSLLAEPRR
jgi:RNA polymerase sigma-70 factor (ECF subfamily)